MMSYWKRFWYLIWGAACRSTLTRQCWTFVFNEEQSGRDAVRNIFQTFPEIYCREVIPNATALYRRQMGLTGWGFLYYLFPSPISVLLPSSDPSYLQASHLCLAAGRRDTRRARGGRRHRPREADDSLELLEAAENGRYKVVAKAEPYKNLPVNHLCMHCGSHLGAIWGEISMRKYKWIFYLTLTTYILAIHQNLCLHLPAKMSESEN